VNDCGPCCERCPTCPSVARMRAREEEAVVELTRPPGECGELREVEVSTRDAAHPRRQVVRCVRPPGHGGPHGTSVDEEGPEWEWEGVAVVGASSGPAELSGGQVEALAGALHDAYRCNCDSGDYDRERAAELAPTVAAMLAAAWPCANYRAPMTCLTAPSSDTGRCDWCRTQAEPARAEVVRDVEAVLRYPKPVHVMEVRAALARYMPSAVREGGTSEEERRSLPDPEETYFMPKRPEVGL
jgi:hypothetical protein